MWWVPWMGSSLVRCSAVRMRDALSCGCVAYLWNRVRVALCYYFISFAMDASSRAVDVAVSVPLPYQHRRLARVAASLLICFASPILRTHCNHYSSSFLWVMLQPLLKLLLVAIRDG
ncbi:hypothetical protein PIB30_020348 [Stylosanthes scabra]|uniref:Secreted protein n=1 Tax=Stylosanthes scabra TaxID=79078 RepID=A0ABU6Z722_9FABA|nr:hypothetical protein [Stylosanthes scabra]